VTPEFSSFSNTTLGVVATNADLNREETTKIAQMAQDGFARAIYPAHTQFDGDIIFALSTNSEAKIDPLLIGTIAADLTATAVLRAARISNQLS
ncbi:peptidase S58 family protein, partial [candidate division KSB1 bacterium]|nr:peptidase S58 family protein [candidate division KSB1 bacterium]